MIEALLLGRFGFRAIEHFPLLAPMGIEPFICGGDLLEAFQRAACMHPVIRPTGANEGWNGDRGQIGSHGGPVVVIQRMLVRHFEDIITKGIVRVLTGLDASLKEAREKTCLASPYCQ